MGTQAEARQHTRFTALLLAASLLLATLLSPAAAWADPTSLTRAELSQVLFDLWNEADEPDAQARLADAPVTTITDLGGLPQEEQDVIQALVDQGILDVNASGEFNPGDTVTRADVAVAVFELALHLPQDVSQPTDPNIFFTDLDAETDPTDAINFLADNALIRDSGEPFDFFPEGTVEFQPTATALAVGEGGIIDEISSNWTEYLANVDAGGQPSDSLTVDVDLLAGGLSIAWGDSSRFAELQIDTAAQFDFSGVVFDLPEVVVDDQRSNPDGGFDVELTLSELVHEDGETVLTRVGGEAEGAQSEITLGAAPTATASTFSTFVPQIEAGVESQDLRDPATVAAADADQAMGISTFDLGNLTANLQSQPTDIIRPGFYTGVLDASVIAGP